MRLLHVSAVALALGVIGELNSTQAQGNLPPRITPTVSLQSQAVFEGQRSRFAVTASGSAPVTYQWQIDGQALPGKTNAICVVDSAKAADEGDYTVVVSNPLGTVTNNPPARLYVVPTNAFVKASSTNQIGTRLPFFYELPANYSPTHTYPLVCYLHGTPNDENSWPSYLNSYALFHVFSSFRLQAVDPAIVVWPTRRAGDNSWTDQYLNQVARLMDELLVRFSIDTNRIYIAGGSEGGHAVWDSLGLRPHLFAAAIIQSGWMGKSPAASIGQAPLWVFQAADDPVNSVNTSRTLVRALRGTGGNPIYTEYAIGGHIDAIGAALCLPMANDWLLRQRRGARSSLGPRLTISSPAADPPFVTGASELNLSGWAESEGAEVTQVLWQNASARASGSAAGTNPWSVTIPLLAGNTNLLVITATTTSWTAGYGGSTTFNNSLAVISSPMQASLTKTGQDLVLRWNGGVGPFDLQATSALSAEDWVTIRTNVTSPWIINPTGRTPAFFRIVGH